MKRIILGVLVVAATAAAQQAAQPATQHAVELQDKLFFESVAAPPLHAPMMARFGGNSAVVKGAPYSAEATTETVQVLADGNRIVNKSGNKSYRDSEGRTRVEITPGLAGAWMPDMKPFSVTVIDDPVSGDHITLNNHDKQATRFSFKGMNVETAGSAGGARHMQNVTMVVRSSGDAAPDVAASGQAHVMEAHTTTGFVHAGEATGVNVNVNGNAFFSSDMKLDVKKEPLGKQSIEGVDCVGTKETATIPAGSVGNERAIETVTERWYSADLQLEVLTKTTDPRFGVTTYTLGNIVRTEQPKSLFEIPADYKVEEPNVNVKIMKSDVK
jgi:hypothetical protein